MTRFLCLCLIAATPVWAWGRKGHRLIASIAERRLATHNPGTLEAIRKLIGPRLSLAAISSCADDIREFARQRRPGVSLPPDCPVDEQDVLTRYANTAPWHFINLPFALRGAPDSAVVKRSCRAGALCITDRIGFFREQLKDPRLSNRSRAIALMFLVHLTGDVHQPLHAIARTGDKGGNTVYVRINGKVMTLHSLWDTHLVSEQRPMPSVEDTNQGSPESWAIESYNDARSIAYRNVPDRPSSPGNPIELPRDYRARAEVCVDRRIRLAGIRLANLLAAYLR